MQKYKIQNGAGISVFVILSVFASVRIACAQQYLSVSSTTDGQGLFSYTFDLGSTSYVWGLPSVPSNTGAIFMPSHGILEVISPLGWTANVDTNQIITWQPVAGTVFLGQPSVTFSVRSSFSGSTNYDQQIETGDYQQGFVFGNVCTLPDHARVGTGLTFFSFIGPKIVSEPSCFINIQANGDSVILSWTNSVFGLQSAPSPMGTYTNVAGATSPFTNSVSEVSRYYRLISY